MQVGKTVSTKTVGSNKRCDVTDSYKFKEGSELERAALGLDEPDGASDVQLDVSFSKQPAIGDNFDVIVTVRQPLILHHPKTYRIGETFN